MTRHILLALLLTCSTWLTAVTTARAGAFDSARAGSERGHAVTPTPLAVYYNPAALGATRRIHIATDITLALRAQSYKRTATTVPEPADAKGANLGTSKALDVLGGPTVAGSFQVQDFTFGAGFFAPFSGFTRWQGNDDFKGNQQYPGAVDGAARWHLIDGSVSLLYFSAAAAYTIRPLRLTLGAGANLIRGAVELTRALNTSFDDRLSTEGRTRLDVSGWMGSFSAGLMAEPIAGKLWLGASYQAPPGMYNGMALNGNLYLRAGGSTIKEAAVLRQSFPDVMRWAVRFKPDDRYELRLFGDYSRWSTYQNQCISKRGKDCELAKDGSSPSGDVLLNTPAEFRDSVGVRAGASYWFNPDLETFVGLGYSSNAVPNKTLSPLLLDGNNFLAALGARVRLGERFALLLSYTHLYYPSRSVKSGLDGYANPSRAPTAAGEYKQWVGLFDTLLEVTFD